MNARLKGLQELTKKQFDILCERFPELRRRGLTLFLGKYYARDDSRSLMLGINPGLDEDLPEDYDLLPENRMLGDPHAPDAQKIVYWRNARRCFGATNDLQNAMEYSTFSFCSPFRTPRWWETPSLQRNMIAECSKPILHQIIEDCHPEVVILSGKQSVAIFSHISGLPLHGRSSPAGGAGARTWAAFTGHGHWGEFLALQVPHFSVFNSLDGLKSCGEWLTSIICEGKSP